MKLELTKLCIRVMILLFLLENRRIECFQRLLNRRLKSSEISSKNMNDIREIVSASLTANEPSGTRIEEKREAIIDQTDDKASIVSEDNNNKINIAPESREASDYEDEGDDDEEDDNQRQVRQKIRVEKSLDQSDLSNDYELDSKNVKDVAKRDVRNENEYDYDDYEAANPESMDSPAGDDPKAKIVARSTSEEEISESERDRSDSSRDTNALDNEESDLDYEKAIENQIQQRIDSIKEDIKRQIEKKQRAREIEANNEKFDELEFPNEENELEIKKLWDSPIRSLSSDSAGNNEADVSKLSPRSKRRSDLNEAGNNEEPKNLVLPVKKRSLARRVTLVQREDTRKRKDRSSILIPEQGHAEVKDDLPADLTLDPNLRISRSNENKDSESENSRSGRLAPRLKDKFPSGRYRRDMYEELEDKLIETPDESAKFLFASREKSDFNSRRRRSQDHGRLRSLDRGKSRKRRRHVRRHRATRESPMEDTEERDKREMDEDAALVEYKESFGGFPGDASGALGRFKRIRRSSNVT